MTTIITELRGSRSGGRLRCNGYTSTAVRSLRTEPAQEVQQRGVDFRSDGLSPLFAEPVERLLAALIDMRGKSALRKMPAELESHERTGGVAGDVFVVALRQAAHRRGVIVGEVGCQVEVVVIDCDRHFLTDRGQAFLDLSDDRFRLGLGVN